MYWILVLVLCTLNELSQIASRLLCVGADDRSAVGGTREDLLSFDTKFRLSYSQFGPVSDHMTILFFNY